MSGGVPARACVCRYFLSSNLDSGERVTYLLPGRITPTSGAAAQRKEGREYLGICPPCLRPDIWFSSDKGLVGREAGPSLPHILFLSPSPLRLPLFASLPGFFSAPPPFLTYYVAQAILKLSILVLQSPQSCGTVYPPCPVYPSCLQVLISNRDSQHSVAESSQDAWFSSALLGVAFLCLCVHVV